jgi:replication-associated recombination protein RarA
MAEFVFHASTKAFISNYAEHPTQSLLIAAPAGSGKKLLARQLVGKTLHIEPAAVAENPYVRIIQPEKDTIGIEIIRALEQFLRLKVPTTQIYNRAVIIEDADKLTLESQNALLKTLEEPSLGVLLILTTGNQFSLLPTILSRVQVWQVQPPTKAMIQEYFEQVGYSTSDVTRMVHIAGLRPSLLHALLNNQDHALLPAITMARQILNGSSFDRLAMIDQLAKQKPLLTDTLGMLQQMASLSLETALPKDTTRWQTILAASYQADKAVNSNAQTKLALTNMMLQLI